MYPPVGPAHKVRHLERMELTPGIHRADGSSLPNIVPVPRILDDLPINTIRRPGLFIPTAYSSVGVALSDSHIPPQPAISAPEAIAGNILLTNTSTRNTGTYCLWPT